MASPQRPNPRGPQPHFEPELQTKQAPRTAGQRVAFAWWWLLLTACVIFGLAWAIWGWSGTGGWWSAGRVKSEPPANVSQRAQPMTVQGTGVEIRTAVNRRPFAGRTFQVSTVPMISKSNNQAVWIGTKTAPPMLLILNSADADANIVPGTLLDVSGTVQKAPTAAQASNEWKLSGSDASQLENQGVYIQATKVYAIEPR
jgi:hypothetical protein